MYLYLIILVNKDTIIINWLLHSIPVQFKGYKDLIAPKKKINTKTAERYRT